MLHPPAVSSRIEIAFLSRATGGCSLRGRVWLVSAGERGMKYSVILCAAVMSWTFLLANAGGLARAGELLTQHNDKQRTGANLEESGLGADAVRDASFGKLWTLYADG